MLTFAVRVQRFPHDINFINCPKLEITCTVFILIVHRLLTSNNLTLNFPKVLFGHTKLNTFVSSFIKC